MKNAEQVDVKSEFKTGYFFGYITGAGDLQETFAFPKGYVTARSCVMASACNVRSDGTPAVDDAIWLVGVAPSNEGTVRIAFSSNNVEGKEFRITFLIAN